MAGIKMAVWEKLIDSARVLFLEKSIEGVKIDEIAGHAQIGEATVYRYFKTKSNLAYFVAVTEWKRVLDTLKADDGGIQEFYNMFLNTFIANKSFYRFLDEFDHHILTDDSIDKTLLSNIFNEIKDVFIERYNRLYEAREIEVDAFYYTTTHALLSLCKKLSFDSLLDNDNKIDSAREIELLIEIIMNSLK